MLAQDHDHHDLLANFEARLKGCKSSGSERTALCPAHDDHTPSLTYRIEERTGDLLVKCHRGCTFAEIANACGLLLSAFFARPFEHSGIARIHTYQDAHGNPSRDVIKYADGYFTQRSYLPNGGTKRTVKGVPVLPYRLPELIAGIARGETIWIPEGEKDVESLMALGLCATTFPYGCDATWKSQHAEFFRNAVRVVVLTDCDGASGPKRKKAGREAALARAAVLRSVVPEITVIDLAPERHDGYDVSDWIAEGGTAEQLLALAEAARNEPSEVGPITATAVDQEARSFAMLQHSITMRRDLTLIEKVVYADVQRDVAFRADPKFKGGGRSTAMSFAAIAERYDLSRRAVIDALKRLETLGFIVAHHSHGGKRHPNVYGLAPLPAETVHSVHSLSRTVHDMHAMSNGAQHAPLNANSASGAPLAGSNGAPHALATVHDVHSYIGDMGDNDSGDKHKHRIRSVAGNSEIGATSDEAGTPEALAAELAANGVLAHQVAQLLAAHPAARIRKQLDLLPQRYGANRVAALLQSIAGDWPAPRIALGVTTPLHPSAKTAVADPVPRELPEPTYGLDANGETFNHLAERKDDDYGIPF